MYINNSIPVIFLNNFHNIKQTDKKHSHFFCECTITILITVFNNICNIKQTNKKLSHVFRMYHYNSNYIT